MKKTRILLVIALIFSAKLYSQNDPYMITERFDDLTNTGFDSGMVVNGKIGMKQYTTNGDILMHFGWDSTYQYWSGNWALSYSHYHKIEPSAPELISTHLYAAAPGKGAKFSEKIFAVGQNHAKLTAANPLVMGILSLKVSNSLYAYNSMKFGDAFAKKFNANDKDSLVLVISSYLKGVKQEAKRVVLADFRFMDTTKNFLLDTWQLIQFKLFNDSIQFEMESSDNGSWGMNTPAFFVVDDIDVLHNVGVEIVKYSKMNVFPNPVKNILNFNSNNSLRNIEVFNFEGQKVLSREFDLAQKSLDVTNFKSGFYSGLVTDQTGKQFSVKFIKE
jgi:hypothetical protein